MSELSILAFKRILKSTGARASEGAAKEMARIIEELAKNLADRSRAFAEHAGRKTIKEKDIRLAAEEWISR
jgi:histone H3/H4